MKKHRINKIRELSGASEPEITPEHHKKNIERTVDMIMDVIDRLPANPAPVLESYEDLLNEMRHGVKRQPTIVVGDEKKAVRASDSLTLYDSGGEENSGKNKFTDLENALLEQIRNGE
jgi:hypothetical protein